VAGWKIAVIVGVLLILAVATAGGVYVNGSLQDPEYCGSCHSVPHYESWADPGTGYTLANAHAQLQITCQACHSRTLSESLGEWVTSITAGTDDPLPRMRLPAESCLKCHGSYDAVASLTADRDRNPHGGHWGGWINCSECHSAHRESVVLCEQCHTDM
jgi:hypothetical protein